MTLKISEGIRKTTKFEFNSTQKVYKQRFPIVFFNREETYRNYSPNISELMDIMKRCLGNEVRYFYLVEIQVVEFKLTNHKTCNALGTD